MQKLLNFFKRLFLLLMIVDKTGSQETVESQCNTKAKDEKEKERNVGGQALIEGVMMRGKDRFSLAVRKPDGEIKVIDDKLPSYMERKAWFKKPFVRGIVAFFENLVIGTRALLISANEALPDEEEIKDKKQKKQKKANTDYNFTLYFTAVISFFLGLGIFVAIPNLLIEKLVSSHEDPVLYNIVSGVFRIALFVAYISVITLLKDIKRVFKYHGSEHKAVNTYESKKELTLENVKTFPTYHPRCGTSFLFFVLLIAIFIFSLINVAIIKLFPALAGEETLDKVIRQAVLTPTHILFLPLIASISYELIKLSFKKQDNIFMKILAYPGYLIQKLTAKEPDDDQLEVAIMALKSAVGELDKEELKELNSRHKEKDSAIKAQNPVSQEA